MSLEIKIAADGSRTYYVDGTETTEADAMRVRDERATQEAVAFRPLVPLPIDGTTVEEVKASAETAITDLAEQMNVRLALLTEGA